MQLLSYALQILRELIAVKQKEQLNPKSELKEFARILWFTGDPKAFEIYKPYKNYVLTELSKDLYPLDHDVGLLQRRIDGLLNGKRYHSFDSRFQELVPKPS